jgi:transposase-like protein
LCVPCPAVKTDGVIVSRAGSSAPVGYRFPREVIAVAVRWYLRYGLSYRDVEELLADRGIEIDHVTIDNITRGPAQMDLDMRACKRQASPSTSSTTSSRPHGGVRQLTHGFSAVQHLDR